MNSGWIKLYRSLLNWEWWHDHNTCRLFLYLILTANIENKTWKGVEVKRGQLITSRAKLSIGTGLSEKQIRTSLCKLKMSQEVASKSASKFSIITICNYDKYQSCKVEEGPAEGPEKGQQRASNGATTKEVRSEETTSLRKSAGKSTQFAEFWTAYPRKKNKLKAIEVWKKTKGDTLFDEIMVGLQRAIISPDWTKEKGKWIPYPAKWLNEGGWMDEAGSDALADCKACMHFGDQCQGREKTCSSYEVRA